MYMYAYTPTCIHKRTNSHEFAISATKQPASIIVQHDIDLFKIKFPQKDRLVQLVNCGHIHTTHTSNQLFDTEKPIKWKSE